MSHGYSALASISRRARRDPLGHDLADRVAELELVVGERVGSRRSKSPCRLVWQPALGGTRRRMRAQGRRACVAVTAAIACASGAAEAAAQSYTRAGGQPVRGHPGSAGGDLGLRPAQPVALLVRSRDRRPHDLRRRPGRRRGGRLRAGRTGAGANYGWSCFEGSLRVQRPPCPAPGHVPPAFEYSSAGTEARCSITGGYVVRDPSLPASPAATCTATSAPASCARPTCAAGTDRALNLVVPALVVVRRGRRRPRLRRLAGRPVFRLRAGPARSRRCSSRSASSTSRSTSRRHRMTRTGCSSSRRAAR